MYSNDQLNKLTVAQLKNILGDMGLTKTGVKADLVARILQGQIVAKAKEEKQNIIRPDDRMANVLKEIRAIVGEKAASPKEEAALLEKKTVKELKQILTNLGKVPKGNKAELIKQIQDVDKQADLQKKVENQLKIIEKKTPEKKKEATAEKLESLSRSISKEKTGSIHEVSAKLNQIIRRSVGVSARKSSSRKHSIGIGISARKSSPRKRSIRSIGISARKSSPRISPDGEWYYLDSENNQMGPYTFRKLATLYLDEKITDETMIWSASYDEEWKQVKDTSFKRMLKNAIRGTSDKPSMGSFVVQMEEIENTIRQLNSNDKVLEKQISDMQNLIASARSNLKTVESLLSQDLLDEITNIMKFLNRICNEKGDNKKYAEMCSNRQQWLTLGNRLAQAVFRIREQMKEFQ